MILGIISAFLLLFLLLKYFSRKFCLRKLDKLLLKSHRFLGIFLVVISTFHMCSAYKLRYQRPPFMTIAGILMLVLVLIAVCSGILNKKIGRNWLLVHRTSSILIFLLLIVHIFLGVTSFSSYQHKIASITTFQNIDIKNVKDGKYEGEYDAEYIYAKVNVTVKNGKITAIDILKHRNERGLPAEKITDRIISAQSLDVDAVSGATNSSKVIKKAIENALLKGIN